MKKVFSEPQVRLMTFRTRDIITTSGEGANTSGNNASITDNTITIGNKGEGSGTAF